MYCTDYVVKRGDTLYKISRQLNVPIDAIMQANPLVNVYRLQVDDVLCIPAATPQTTYTNYTTYLIQEGDSLGSILSSDTFTINDIMSLNDPNDIMLQPGTTIKIPITGVGEGGISL